MTWARKNGWCKDSKEVTGKKARRGEKKGSHRLRWLDDVYSELRSMDVKRWRTGTWTERYGHLPWSKAGPDWRDMVFKKKKKKRVRSCLALKGRVGRTVRWIISQTSEMLMVESKFFAEQWPVNASSTVFWTWLELGLHNHWLALLIARGEWTKYSRL